MESSIARDTILYIDDCVLVNIWILLTFLAIVANVFTFCGDTFWFHLCGYQDQNYSIRGDSLFPSYSFKCHSSLWYIKLVSFSTPLSILIVGYSHLGVCDFLLFFSYHPLNKREIVSGTGHLADYSVKSWLLEENLQPLIHYPSTIPNNNLWTFLFIYVCALHSPSESSLCNRWGPRQKITASHNAELQLVFPFLIFSSTVSFSFPSSHVSLPHYPLSPFLFFLFFFWYKVSLCSPRGPRTVGSPDSGLQGLGLQVYSPHLALFTF